jgi:hypothetical protein
MTSSDSYPFLASVQNQQKELILSSPDLPIPSLQNQNIEKLLLETTAEETANLNRKSELGFQEIIPNV